MGANWNTQNFMWIQENALLLWGWSNRNGLLREIVKSPPIETLKTRLDMVLGNLLYLTTLEQGGWTRWFCDSLSSFICYFTSATEESQESNSLTCTGGRTTPYAVSVMPFPSCKSSLPWSLASHNKPLTRCSNISVLPHLQGPSKILIFFLTAHCPPYLPHTSLYPLLTSPILQEVC